MNTHRAKITWKGHNRRSCYGVQWTETPPGLAQRT